jgi:hypothetical protein
MDENLNFLEWLARKFGLENLEVVRVSCCSEKDVPRFSLCILWTLSLSHVRNVLICDNSKRDTSSEAPNRMIQRAKECAVAATWPSLHFAVIYMSNRSDPAE